MRRHLQLTDTELAVSSTVFVWKRLNVCFGLSTGEGKRTKKNGDGCFAKVWISSLEFLTKFTLRGLVAK